MTTSRKGKVNFAVLRIFAKPVSPRLKQFLSTWKERQGDGAVVEALAA